MKKNKKEISSQSLMPVFLIGILLLLHEPFEDLISKVFITPIFGKISFIGHPLAQIALSVIALMFIYLGIKKLTVNYIFSTAWLKWGITISIYYSLYRFSHIRWEFHDFFIIGNFHIKAFDLIYLFVVYFSIAAVKKSFDKNENNSDLNLCFQVDEPRDLIEGDDIHSRKRFIEQIGQSILNTNNEGAAFAIGIIGKWGTGKTSFMESLGRYLKSKENGIIQFTFNPWLIEDSKNITEVFFSEFSNELSRYTDTVDRDLAEYIRAIIVEKPANVFLNTLRFISPSFSVQRNNIEYLRGKLNEALKGLRKKIIVYVDDVDRLDKKETIEVLRLIRNSANFGNVTFVVAFDKVQIVQSLKNTFDSRFLEKIIQVEFYLPPLSSNAIFADLLERVERILSLEDKNSLKLMFGTKQTWGLNNYNLVKSYFHHHRDVVRFINQFEIHYKFIKGEIYLPDFFVIMVLRFRYPEVYYYIYNNKDNILDFTNFDDAIYETGRGEFTIPNEKIDQMKNSFRLLKETLIIEDYEIDNLFELIIKLFPPQKAQDRFFEPSIGEIPKSHLSIRYDSYFDRYFDYSFTGRLSDVDFENAFNGDKEEFLKRIKIWMHDDRIGSEIIDSLERKTKYKNEDEFDKIISGIASIYQLGWQKNDFAQKIDLKKFIERFVSLYLNGMYTVKVFDGENNLADYIRKWLLTQKSINCIWYDVAKEISLDTIYNYKDSFPVDWQELKKYLVDSCIASINSMVNLDWEFLRAMKIAIDYDETGEALRKSKKYIVDNCLDKFIQMIIQPCHYHGSRREPEFIRFMIADWADLFFESKEGLSDFLKNEKTTSKYKDEFLKFFDAIKNGDPENHCVPFIFNTIPVEKN